MTAGMADYNCRYTIGCGGMAQVCGSAIGSVAGTRQSGLQADQKARRISYNRRRRHEKERRIRQLRREYAVLISIIAGILIGCFAASGFRTSASSDDTERKFKYYQNVTVSYDQTLEDLAIRYADPEYYHGTQEYLDEVAQINHLTVDNGRIQQLTPGTHIIVPYYRQEFVQ